MTDSGLPPGSVFAGYQIERVLGVGGMGTVYLARNPSLPRSDALKVLSAELSRDANFRARFVREADVSAGLSHPNIVGIYRRGEADGQLWIAMQFVDGTDAEKALQAGTMTPRRAVHIIGEVAKALDYAHQRHVVHRDVKPANFLLSSDGDEGERVLLADFGIARALDDAHSLTATGSVMATVTYAAPEALTGAKVDGRADIYGLGCSLFRLMTGRAPYPGKDIAAVMMAHLNQPPPRLSSVRPGLPPALDDVLAKAMAKDPAQRYGTARELAAASYPAIETPLLSLHEHNEAERAAQLLQELLARHVGQAEVEQDGVVFVRARRDLRVHAIAHPVDPEALALQGVHRRPAQHFVVFHQQQLHASTTSTGPPSPGYGREDCHTSTASRSPQARGSTLKGSSGSRKPAPRRRGGGSSV